MTTTYDMATSMLTLAADIQVSASRDAVDLAAARTEAHSAITQVAALETVVEQQRLVIAAQQARIAELEGDPPTPRSIAVGASVQRRAGESWAGALARFEASIGKRLQVVRRYTAGIPDVTDDAFADVIRPDAPYRVLILSFKQGTQTEIESFMRALPVVPGRTYMLALYHEPDKQLRLTPAAFQALCARLAAADQNVQRPDVSLAAILMTWLERDGNTATSSLDYMPPPSPRWVLLMDPYFPRPENTYASQCGQTVALWRQLGGTRIGLAEFGVKTTGPQAAEQITAIAAAADVDGCETLTYFDSDQGDNAAAGWYLDLRGPEAVAAFAALID